MATILENVYALSAHLEDAYGALEAKGATIPATKNATNLSATIDGIPAGGGPSDIYTKSDLVFDGVTTLYNPYSDPYTGTTFGNRSNIRTASFPDLSSSQTGGLCHIFRDCSNLSAVSMPRLTSFASTARYVFHSAFFGCSMLESVDIPQISFSVAGTVGTGNFAYAFSGCKKLTRTIPLNNSVVAPNCYQRMYSQCTSLVEINSTFPATTLANSCYQYMFQGCAALTAIPSLTPALLAQYCYQCMFQNCTGLSGEITIPVSNTNTSIPNNAFQSMFHGCSNLTKVILDFSTFSSIPTLGGTSYINVFNSTTDARLEIHVPSALVDTWKTASNWSTWASRIVGV